MTQAARKLTFEEYLTLNAEVWVRLGLPEGRCEFVDGEIVELPFEDRINAKIALFLLTRLANVFPEDRLCCKDTEIEVRSSKARTRVPDLMLLSEDLAAVLGDGRSTITLDMPPPDLIVEVVSPGSTNENRDYNLKRAEYAARRVPEYWAIAPEESKITVFTLVNGAYEEAVYTGKMFIQSRFEVLRLTAEQVLKRKR
jgi:Uma2 family endonuclease